MISTFFSVKQLPFFMFICASALLFIGCETDDTDYSNDQNQPHAVNKIMPLGASRIQGLSPIFESYRYELWKDLVDGGWSFDFIGTEVEIGFYSDYQGIPFDTDHQGKGGWTSGQILEDLAASLEKAGVPDIVLFSSPGGNDLLNDLPYVDVIENVNAIIDLLQQVNPDITIVIELLAPGRTDFMTPELNELFTQAIDDISSIAIEQSDANSQVIPVNMHTGFLDDYLFDDIHYNKNGAVFITDRYYEVLQNILN